MRTIATKQNLYKIRLKMLSYKLTVILTRYIFCFNTSKVSITLLSPMLMAKLKI